MSLHIDLSYVQTKAKLKIEHHHPYASAIEAEEIAIWLINGEQDQSAFTFIFLPTTRAVVFVGPRPFVPANLTIASMNPAEIAHGPILIGFTLNAILLGVMMTQVYLYYTSFKKDKAWIKIFVAVLFALDIFNTACGAAYLYKALIIHFNDPAYLNEATWLLDMGKYFSSFHRERESSRSVHIYIDPPITGVIVTTVQSFFAWRIYVLTKSWIFPLIIIATAITGGITAILTPMEIAKAPHILDLIKAKVLSVLWRFAKTLPLTLETCLSVGRYPHYRDSGDIPSKHKTGFEGSDMLVDRIIRLTIQTGLITSVVALINLVVYLSDTTGLHLLFNFALCKLYSNSLMSTLNSRGIWTSGPSGMSTGRETEDHATSMTINYRPQIVQPPPMKPSEIINFNGKKHTEVYVNVESHELQDGTGMRSQLPLGKGAFDDKGRDF
ncbi:hypothetical protein BDZ97DRAFT_1755025 [Flammula alnicola]|nr:hypothetical protein BDZ97DRAFT_1755025 [Flammula alnicola]